MAPRRDYVTEGRTLDDPLEHSDEGTLERVREPTKEHRARREQHVRRSRSNRSGVSMAVTSYTEAHGKRAERPLRPIRRRSGMG